MVYTYIQHITIYHKIRIIFTLEVLDTYICGIYYVKNICHFKFIYIYRFLEIGIR